MQTYTTHDHAALVEGLSALATGTDAVRSSGDAYGNAYRWFHLDTPRHMTRAAELLARAGARLATTTAYNLRLAEPVQEICYHFELDGVGNVEAEILQGQPGEGAVHHAVVRQRGLERAGNDGTVRRAGRRASQSPAVVPG